MIEISNLSCGYGSLRVLQELDLRLNRGESLVILGHNGAGKSTLLKTLFGLIPPLSGTGQVLGRDLCHLSPRTLVTSGARYLGQGIRGFDEVRIRESRSVLTRLYGIPPSSESAGNFSFRKRVGQLSVGQRRLEALRLVAAGKPRLFFLDEPMAGVDPRTEEEILSWIGKRQQSGASFVIVEQRFRRLLEGVELALVIRSSRVSYYGSAQRLLANERLAEVYL